MLGEKDKKRYLYLRRLVGMSFTPAAVSAAVPTLRNYAIQQVEKITAALEPVKMEDICTDFTLDVAWRQIFRLDLEEEDIKDFQQAVNECIGGMISPCAILKIGIKSTKCYKAMQYLKQKIEEKIQYLEQSGLYTNF